MAAHLDVLRSLSRQCAIFRLTAGRDLHRNAAAVAGLIANQELL
jgi:hypothetical protein